MPAVRRHPRRPWADRGRRKPSSHTVKTWHQDFDVITGKAMPDAQHPDLRRTVEVGEGFSGALPRSDEPLAHGGGQLSAMAVTIDRTSAGSIAGSTCPAAWAAAIAEILSESGLPGSRSP
jgi:hypothetical protein